MAFRTVDAHADEPLRALLIVEKPADDVSWFRALSRIWLQGFRPIPAPPPA